LHVTSDLSAEDTIDMNKLPPRVSEKLGHYVYLYRSPLDGKVFYVGKGKGNRVLAHLNDTSENRKVAVIQKIREASREPLIEILAHQLPNELTAFQIEAAAIDLLGIHELTNAVHGFGPGRMRLEQITALYGAKPVVISEPVILIRINQLYRYDMTAEELYEATRGVWKLGQRRQKAQYAMAVYRGVVRKVFKINEWHRAGTTPYKTRAAEEVNVSGRWEFTGVEDARLGSKYIDKSVEKYFPRNTQSPIMYVGC